MFGVFLTFHIIVCVFLIFIVLLQSGRGAELGAAFGSMGQATYSRGNMGMIGKMTTVAAVLFMLTSLILAYLSSENAVDSVLKDVPPPPAATAPVIPTGELEIQAETQSEENPTEPSTLIEQFDTSPSEGNVIEQFDTSPSQGNVIEQFDAPATEESSTEKQR